MYNKNITPHILDPTP